MTRRRALLLLLLVTLLGGVLRFSFIGRPSLWGDEALTYARVAGSYGDLLQQLQIDGFAPLHYELYWSMRQLGLRLTPFAMRLVPALAGTLMIPAMYWLARQFVGRRPALVTALFTAGSAYLLVYSRDAKMYMHFWLFATINMAALLQWFRTRQRLLWWVWIISGLIAVGLDPLWLILLFVQILFLLSQRQAHWMQTLFFSLGLAFILAGPAGYYGFFNQWLPRVQHNPRTSGINWIESYNAGRNGTELAGYTASAFLLSWEWPKADELPTLPPRLVTTLKITCIALFSLALAGFFPWPARWRGTAADPSPRPWWRTALWLAFWLVLPAYGFYCVSESAKSPPWSWFSPLTAHTWTIILSILFLGLCFYFCADTWPGRLRRTAWVGSIVVILLALGFLIQKTVPSADHSVWMPRYLGILWPAFAIVLCALIWRLPTRPVRWGALALLLSANLAQFTGRLFAGAEPPLARAAADVLADPSNESSTRTYTNLLGFAGGAPATANLTSPPGRYYLSLLSGRPLTPNELRSGRADAQFNLRPLFAPQQIAAEVHQTPHVTRLILWQCFTPTHPPDDSDPLLPLLGPDWKLISQTRYPVRDHWKWQLLSTWQRR